MHWTRRNRDVFFVFIHIKRHGYCFYFTRKREEIFVCLYVSSAICEIFLADPTSVNFFGVCPLGHTFIKNMHEFSNCNICSWCGVHTLNFRKIVLVFALYYWDYYRVSDKKSRLVQYILSNLIRPQML